jgi:hypothetical protein
VIATPDDNSSYGRFRDKQAAISRQRSQTGRDIGDIPPIANPERREACRKSLRLFCETYNPEAFYLGWSPDHLRMIERIEESAYLGALFAFAMARGSGKTSICRMATLWAASYAIRLYPFLIGATAGKAEESLSTIKIWMRYLPLYTDDFPEISYPARAIGGVANRATGQLCNGESTLIEWAKDRIVLPRVPKPPNLDHDGIWAPTSGIVLGVSGLTGEGIRGSLFAHPDGRLVRPDWVLLDDPQTDESAGSLTQNDTRESLLAGAVLGMAGPDKTIAAVMPCTVIRKNDMADRILDRSKHPLWRGERTRMLRTMPTNMEAWERYFEVYRHCMSQEPPDIQEANDHYLEHRVELDAGAEASWDARKLADEVSAIQHAMNLYCRNRAAFFAEYQNDPLEAAVSEVTLTADQISSKTSTLARREIPADATTLTAMIDVHLELLYYTVTAWQEGFSGDVIDYGTFPPQNRSYFALRDAQPTLERAYRDATGKTAVSEDEWIWWGLDQLSDSLLGREWLRQDNVPLNIGLCMIDANWGQKTPLVKKFCRQSKHRANILASHGRYIKAGHKAMDEFKPRPGEQVGKGVPWRKTAAIGGHRHLVWDTNWWKSFTYARLSVGHGGAGCLSLFKGNHQLFADHMTSEKESQQDGPERKVPIWELIPGRDNHWFDTTVGCVVAASVLGVTLPTMGESGKHGQSRRLSLAEMKAQARKH